MKANGQALEALAATLGVRRNGDSDDVLRERVRAKIRESPAIGSPAHVEFSLRSIYGVRRVALLEAGAAGFGVVAEGGDEGELRQMIEAAKPMGITYDLVVWRAPWWWRAWCRVLRWMGRA